MITIDGDAKTSPAHGCTPAERTIEELLEAGMLVIDKPQGPNSHQVSAWARDILGLDKLGHGGTLDPFATGVLVLLSGRAMRLTKKVLSHDKTYVGVLRAPNDFDKSALERAIAQMCGQVRSFLCIHTSALILLILRTLLGMKLLTYLCPNGIGCCKR